MFNLFFPLKNKNSNEVHIGLLVCSKFRSIALFSLTGLAPRWYHLPNNFGIRLKPRNLNQKNKQNVYLVFSFKNAPVLLEKLHIPRKNCTSLHVTSIPKNANASKVHFQTRIFSQIIHENWFKTVQVRSSYSQGVFSSSLLSVSNRHTRNSSLCTRTVGLLARNFSGQFSPNITKLPLKRSTALPYRLLRVFVQRRNETKRKPNSSAEPVVRSRGNNWQDIRPKTDDLNEKFD